MNDTRANLIGSDVFDFETNCENITRARDRISDDRFRSNYAIGR